MPIATVSSKGQVTIPKEVRERLGIHQGDRIEFVVDSQGAVSLQPLKRSVRELAGFLHRPGRPAVTLKEMDESVSRRLGEDDERIRSKR